MGIIRRSAPISNPPYYDWYTFNHYPEDYKAWWGILSLPELRKDNPEYQKFMFQPHEGVVPRWIEAGSCGWRLDVADELPVDFLRKLRAAAKAADPEAVVLGEVWRTRATRLLTAKRAATAQATRSTA